MRLLEVLADFLQSNVPAAVVARGDVGIALRAVERAAAVELLEPLLVGRLRNLDIPAKRQPLGIKRTLLLLVRASIRHQVKQHDNLQEAGNRFGVSEDTRYPPTSTDSGRL